MCSLTWKSPYKAGEIHPAYEVRVYGNVNMNSALIRPMVDYSEKKPQTGYMQFLAGDEPISIYVHPSSTITLANDRAKIELQIFESNF